MSKEYTVELTFTVEAESRIGAAKTFKSFVESGFDYLPVIEIEGELFDLDSAEWDSADGLERVQNEY